MNSYASDYSGLNCHMLAVGYYEDGHSEAWSSCITMTMAYIPIQDLSVTVDSPGPIRDLCLL